MNIKNKKRGYISPEAAFITLIILTILLIGFNSSVKRYVLSYINPTETKTVIENIEVERVIFDEGYVTTELVADDKGNLMPINNTYPDTFTVIFTHNDHTHSISSKKIYDLYKDRVGETVKANIYTNIYKDGRESHTIDIILDKE